MIIYPSIDIQDGKCVRLIQGHFHLSTTYDLVPQQRANQFRSEGAQFLHIVDLDGAKQGKICQLETIAEIIKAFKGVVQVGGGIREASDLENLFKIGASRAVIGSKAMQKPEVVKTWLKEWGAERIVLALDFKFQEQIPYLVSSGWQQETGLSLYDLLNGYSDILHILCTDVAKDGMMQGPNFSFYHQLCQRQPSLQVQASGGVGSIADISRLGKYGVAGCIIGKAIYEKTIDLKEALQC